MADPLSNVESTDSMEHGTDTAVAEARKASRKRKRLQPSALANSLGNNMLKQNADNQAITTCQYGSAGAAGIKLRGAKACKGEGYGSVKTTNFAEAARSGIAKMAMQYPELLKVSNEWADMASKTLHDLGSGAVEGFKGLDPTLRSSLGYGGALGLGGAAIGGIKGMFDEKDDEDESRIGHALRSAGKWGGIGGLAGLGGGALASEAGRYGPEIEGIGKAVASGPTAIKKLPRELSQMQDLRSLFSRGTQFGASRALGYPQAVDPVDKEVDYLTNSNAGKWGGIGGLAGLGGGALASEAVDPVDKEVDYLTKSNADKLCALAYPALAKFAGMAPPAPGASPGGGNPAATTMGMSSTANPGAGIGGTTSGLKGGVGVGGLGGAKSGLGIGGGGAAGGPSGLGGIAGGTLGAGNGAPKVGV